jgi:hypothetical protein
MKLLISRFLTILSAVALSLAASMLFSCAREVEIDIPQPSAAEITFGISVATKVQPATRAITEGETDDNDVREITIMLFDPNTGLYERSVRTTSVAPVAGTGNENLRTFKANIPPGSYKALFLANAATMIDEKYDIVNGLVKGDPIEMIYLSMDDIEGALKRTFSEKYNAKPGSTGYTPFVMSSDRISLTVPSTVDYSANPIPLSRDVAKINVKFKDQTVSDRFKINEIRLCNYNTLSYVVPASGWWSNTSPLFAATGVTRPVGSIVTGYTGIPYSYKDSDGDGIEDEDSDIKNNGCIDEIFTAERSVGSDNLFLLIKGDVTISGVEHTDRWYKIEFTRKEDGGDKPKHVNILRNYSYTVTISDISNPGYGSKDEAYNHPAGNLVVDLTAVEDDGLNSFVYSGQHYLGVTKNLYEFSCISELEQELKIHTDYPGGWKITLPADGWPSWAGAAPVLSGEGGNTTSGNLWPEVNLVDLQREFTFTVSAGSLSQQITVRQRKHSYIFATPGVPGIRLSDLRRLMAARTRSNDPSLLDPNIALTLKGSGTYRNTDVESTATEFGGLANEPVYTLHFLWGSMVALLMPGGETWPQDGRHAVWTNTDFTGNIKGPMDTPSTFVTAAYKSTDTDYDIADDPEKGHGDICREITAGAYRMPAGEPWRLADGTTPFGNSKELKWYDPANPAVWVDINNPPYVETGMGPHGMAHTKDRKYFLPAAGYIVPRTGRVSSPGSHAIYQTSTVHFDEKGQGGYAIMFANSDFNSPTRNLLLGNIAMPVRCVKAGPAVVPTLTVTPDPVYVGYDAGSKAEIVVTTNQSSWAVSAKPAWIDVDTSNGTITVNNTNTGTSERSGPLTITAGSATPVTVTVIQAPQPQLPFGKTVAPPGVLGYTAGSRKLTLKGSREYAGTELETKSEFGRVSNETVYVAYFQYGSLIAISSEANDNVFTTDDIVWAPAGYKGTATDADALIAARALLTATNGPQRWFQLPSGTNWSGSVKDGLGDPCKYAEAGGTNWQVPSKSQLSSFTFSATKWYIRNGFENRLPLSAGRVMGASAPHDWSMFLAATGYRNSQDGKVVNGFNESFDFGYYWYNSFANGTGDNLSLFSSEVKDGSITKTAGYAIRCVRSTK